MLTPRDTQIIASLAHYYTLTRAQINRLHFPDDDDGRITRRRLQLLLDTKLIQRTNMQVVNPSQGAPAPVYFPSREGCLYLAQETGEERFLRACTFAPNWQSLYHWVAVAETHILLDRAVALLADVSVVEWVGEWSVVNPEERLPEKRFRLYTRFDDRLVCVPDAAFLLEKASHRKVFYVEQDRDTTKNAERVAAQKHAGYAQLAEKTGHLRHFPAATVKEFAVLMIAPSERRRDTLRKAFAAKSGASLWKFATTTELTPESMLTGTVWHSCEGEVSALLRSSGGAA